ncbi:maleylpyruvate isomerase family mycothiol-dependent enzyme [Nocardioides sp. GY 10127]|uniref:maleylpyruvate isomerase family mycothiol-dependent enzyme n=1 Tax=Nocardioides sp. GY 10127 TaxID=2569762 RepID=UPI0010A88785|nr:maleylpyruvate isomerase family mycothiol-dependent enzyme [Nocardioides sp. GY 10127]TIC82922.1 maleylpyruvate isomerase family mycothiol-dependent enzyme [Nocardioides sp. GY 10127]
MTTARREAPAELRPLLDVWWTAVGGVLDVLADLDEAEWDLPTDLPGWDVRAIASHVAHAEAVIATGEQETADVGREPHVRNPLGAWTEIGVANRRSATPAALLAEIRTVTSLRRASLRAEPPLDPDAPAPSPFGDLGWSVRTLLRNRPFDLWMHEQDLRRATGRPGGLDTAAADHAVAFLAESLGYVLVKRARAEAGDSVVLALAGEEPRAALVGPDGRARPAPVPDAPTLVVRTDRETFVRLAGGRCRPQDVAAAVVLEGDEALGERFLAGLTTTP